MKKDGKYRFSLQFGMDSKEEVQAGELLERLGNRKSAVVVAAIGEYLRVHPEMLTQECRINVRFTGMDKDGLEEMIRQIVDERLAITKASGKPEPEMDKVEMAETDILEMLGDLDIFNA